MAGVFVFLFRSTPTTHPPRFNFGWNCRIDYKSMISLFLSLGGLLVINGFCWKLCSWKVEHVLAQSGGGGGWYWAWPKSLPEQTIASYPTQSQPIALHYCLLLFVCSSFVFEDRLVSSRICSTETNFLWASADWHFCSFGNGQMWLF